MNDLMIAAIALAIITTVNYICVCFSLDRNPLAPFKDKKHKFTKWELENAKWEIENARWELENGDEE